MRESPLEGRTSLLVVYDCQPNVSALQGDSYIPNTDRLTDIYKASVDVRIPSKKLSKREIRILKRKVLSRQRLRGYSNGTCCGGTYHPLNVATVEKVELEDRS